MSIKAILATHLVKRSTNQGNDGRFSKAIFSKACSKAPSPSARSQKFDVLLDFAYPSLSR
jgi:hypothetical protein